MRQRASGIRHSVDEAAITDTVVRMFDKFREPLEIAFFSLSAVHASESFSHAVENDAATRWEDRYMGATTFVK